MRRLCRLNRPMSHPLMSAVWSVDSSRSWVCSGLVLICQVFHCWTGSCYRGADCRFLHDGPKGSATVGSHIRTSLLCFEIAEKGRCSYGSECRYSHDLKLAGESSVSLCGTCVCVCVCAHALSCVAVGARQQLDRSDRSDRVCYNWEDEGRCAWGDHCRFLHGAAIESILPCS